MPGDELVMLDGLVEVNPNALWHLDADAVFVNASKPYVGRPVTRSHEDRIPGAGHRALTVSTERS